VALSAEDVKDLADKGIEMAFAVGPADKLTTIWGKIKVK
jgi:hypothetical protein